MKPPPEVPAIHYLRAMPGNVSRVVIVTHAKPDGDALGSSLGLMHVLKAKGIPQVQVISPTDWGGFLNVLPGAATVWDGIANREKAMHAIADAEVIFCLDFSAVARMETLQEAVLASHALKVMVDHHLHPEAFSSYTFHRASASSTCELIFELVTQAFGDDCISRDAAYCLYTGLMTDTGSFRHNSTTPAVHRIAADLISKGLDVSEIHHAIFDSMGENRLRFLGYCLNEKLKVLQNLHTAYMCISYPELKKFNIRTGDTEGFVNYCLSIAGIRFGVMIIDRGGIVKLSFRSVGNFAANEFATHFGGGGHYNAAGGASHLTLQETEKKFLDLLYDHKEQLVHAD